MRCSEQCRSRYGILGDIANGVASAFALSSLHRVERRTMVRTNEKPNSPPERVGMIDGISARPVQASLIKLSLT